VTEAVVELPATAATAKAGLAVALREAACGEPEASSETSRFAVRWPGASGLKTMAIVQLDAGATGAVQLLVKLKSEGFGPARDTPETCSGPDPELMRVSVCGALDVPCVLAGNAGAVGEKVTVGTGAVPVPFSKRVCGLPGALSAT